MTRKRKVRTTIDPGRELEVDQAEYSRLKEQGLLLPAGVPVWVASTRVDGGPGKAVAVRRGAGGPLTLGSHTIRTTIRPDEEITVDDGEYQSLLDLHLVYDGTPPDPVADPFDARVAEFLAVDGSSTQTAIDEIITGSITGAQDPYVAGVVANQASATYAALRTAFGSPNEGYLLACFRAAVGDVGGDQKLSVLYSPDGETFFDPAYNPVYSPQDATPGKLVRDPSVIYRDGYFYVCHTNSGSSATSFDIVRSADLATWSAVATVDMSSIGSVTDTWAPEFVVDGADVYVFVSINIRNPYWVKATADDLSTWTTPTALTVTGRPAKIIDPCFVKKGSTWYCFFVDADALTGGTPSIRRATASTLTGTYATDRTGNWAGWGSTYYEGPSVVERHDGGYRIYLDGSAAVNDLTSFYYADSTDLDTWTGLQPVRRFPAGVPYKLRHGTVLPLDAESRTRAAARLAPPTVYTPKPLLIPLTVDVAFTSTSYADLSNVTGTFIPHGSKVAVTIAGTASQGSSTFAQSVFRVVASGGATTTKVFNGALESNNGSRTSLPSMTAIFQDLTPGVPVTFTLQAEVTSGATLYLRPNAQQTEGLTMVIEDAA